MKTKLYNTLNKPYIVILTMIFTPLFGFIDRNFVFFSALAVAFYIFWGSKFDRTKFGLDNKLNWNTFFKSLLYTFILFFIDYIFIGPVLDTWLGEADLSSFDDVKGNLGGYISLMLIMWVFAAFGEEFLNRGFYMKWFAEFIGNTKKSWIIAAVVTSLYFAIGHIYQGYRGVLGTFIWSLLVSFIFMKNRKNLWLLILIHGFYDTIGITLLYFGKIDTIGEWVKQLF